MDAAKAAIRFEKPAFTQTAIDMSVRPVRAKDLSDDELAAIIVGGSKQLPAAADELVDHVESTDPDEAVK
jgi:hypothetical protein